MPKYAVTKAMKVLLETTNNNSESQLVWWCCGHDCVARSQGNPSVPLLSGSTMQSVNGTWYNCKQCWPFCEYCQWIPSHHFICWSSCTEPQECCCERSEQQQTCLINYWKIYGNYLVQCGISMEILQVMQLMSLYREWGLEGMVCHFTFYTTVDQVPGLIVDGPVLRSSFALALECPRSAVRKTPWLLCCRSPLTLLLVGEYNPSVRPHTCVP